MQKTNPGVRPKVFVYGHTHSRDKKENFKVNDSWFVNIFNTGAFQRVVDEQQLRLIIDKKNLRDATALKVLRPEDLPPCYTFVRVDYAGGRPIGSLQYWSKKEAAWKQTETCSMEAQ